MTNEIIFNSYKNVWIKLVIAGCNLVMGSWVTVVKPYVTISRTQILIYADFNLRNIKCSVDNDDFLTQGYLFTFLT